MGWVNTSFRTDVTIAWPWITWCYIWPLGLGYSKDAVWGCHRVEATDKTRNLQHSCTQSPGLSFNSSDERPLSWQRSRRQTLPLSLPWPPSMPWSTPRGWSHLPVSTPWAPQPPWALKESGDWPLAASLPGHAFMLTGDLAIFDMYSILLVQDDFILIRASCS